MHWKTKRLIGTAIVSAIPFLGITFVAWDFAAPLATESARAGLLFLTLFVAGAAFTFPGWDW